MPRPPKSRFSTLRYRSRFSMGTSCAIAGRESGALMVVELLADAPEIAVGRVEPLPTDGNISALNIPHSSIVFEMHQVAEIWTELLDDAGIAVEVVRHADLVSFTCLKAFAFDQRFERKDAHDLIYCIEHAGEGLDGAARMFREALAGGHGEVIRDCLSILHNRFAEDDEVKGYGRNGGAGIQAVTDLDEAACPSVWSRAGSELPGMRGGGTGKVRSAKSPAPHPIPRGHESRANRHFHFPRWAANEENRKGEKAVRTGRRCGGGLRRGIRVSNRVDQQIQLAAAGLRSHLTP